MKQLLTFCALFFPLLSFAQKLPTDSLTHKVAYQGVVAAPGATQADLMARAQRWAAGLPTDRTTVKAVSPGEVVITTNKDYTQTNAVSPGKHRMWCVVSVQAKDGRYRYEVTNFESQGYFTGGSRVPLSKQTERIVLDPWFSNPKNYTKKGEMKPLVAEMAKNIDAQAQGLVKDLKSTMTGAAARGW